MFSFRLPLSLSCKSSCKRLSGNKRFFSAIPSTQTIPNVPKHNENSPSAPVVKTSKLSNGIRVTSVASQSHPLTSLGIFIEGGSRYEDPASSGVSFFLKHFGFQKTATRSSLRLIRDFEALGASYSVNVGREYLYYSSDFQSDKLDEVIPILADVLRPQFEEHLIKAELENIRITTEEALSNPTVQVIEQLHAEAFRNKGLGLPLYPSVNNLHHLDTNILQDFFLKHRTADKMALVAVGDVDHEKLLQQVSIFSSLPSRPSHRLPSEYISGDSRILANSASTHVAFAFSGASYKDKEFLALGALKFLLGGGKIFSRDTPGSGLASRFNRNLIAKSKGEIQQVSAFNFNYSDAGLFGVYGVTAPGKSDQFIDHVSKEIASLYSGAIESKELERAKSQLKADILFNGQSRPSLLEFVGLHVLAKDEVVIPTEFIKRIDSLTVEDVRGAAKRVFRSKPTISAVGNIWNVPTREQLQSALQ